MRDSYGLPRPQGTCVLLDVDNHSALINYFQSLYGNSTGSFELRGVHITTPQIIHTSEENQVICTTFDADQQRRNNNTNSNANNANDIILRCCCAVFLLLNPVAIGIQTQWTQFLIMEENFMLKC